MHDGVSSEAGGSGVVVVPENHLCARCGYPSGRSGSVVCPECGWEVTPGELEAAGRVRESLAAWRQFGRVRWQVAWAAIVLGYWVGLSVLCRSFNFAMPWGIGAGCLLPVSWVMGALVSRGLPLREHREFARMTWERQLWILHLPWLVMPVLAVVFLALAPLDRVAGTSGIYPPAMLLIGLLWLVGCILSLAAWWRQRGVAFRTAGVRPASWSNRLAFLAGLVVSAGAGLVGVWGGGAAVLVIGILTGAVYWD